VLEHLCRSITTILWARPGLHRVCFDLTRIRRLDASGAALLRYAFRELQKAGVEVDIAGTGNRTTQVLTQEPRRAADIAESEARRVELRRTLH
jgi:ABC-type transporter Mla MlaB component